MLSSSPMVDSPKALAIPHYIGQNGCLPSFYVIFTSTHDNLVETWPLDHYQWIVSPMQWLATIENQCFHRVQWLTLQKPLPFHIGQNGCLPMHNVHFVKYDDAVSFYDAVSDTIRRRGGNRGIFTEEGVDTVAYFGGNHGFRV